MVSRMDMLLKMVKPLKDFEDEAYAQPGAAIDPTQGLMMLLGRKLAQPIVDNVGGKTLTGAAEAGLGKLMLSASGAFGIAPPEAYTNPNVTGDLPIQALRGYEQATGNPLQRARAANEAGAQGHEWAQAIENALFDPTNLIGPAGKAAQAAKLERVARILHLADMGNEFQGKAIGLGAQKALASKAGQQAIAGVGRKISPQLERALHALAGTEIGPPLPTSPWELPPPMPNQRGDVPFSQLIRGVGEDGGRGLGPQLPPELGPTLDNLPPEHGPAFPSRGDVPVEQMIPGIGGRGVKGRPGVGPVLPPSHDIPLPLEQGPQIPTKGNVDPSELIPGIGERGSKGIGPLLPPSQDIPLPPELGPALDETFPGKLKPHQMPMIGGKRQYGPERPIGPFLPLGAKARPTPITLPPGAVTRAEERAARAVPDLIDSAAPPAALDFPQLAGDRRTALGQLSTDEIGTLLDLAYPGDTALGSAIAKYPDPIDLTDAALARITRDNHALATLARTNDPLARKLAYLPEPGEGGVTFANPEKVTPPAIADGRVTSIGTLTTNGQSQPLTILGSGSVWEVRAGQHIFGKGASADEALQAAGAQLRQLTETTDTIKMSDPHPQLAAALEPPAPIEREMPNPDDRDLQEFISSLGPDFEAKRRGWIAQREARRQGALEDAAAEKMGTDAYPAFLNLVHSVTGDLPLPTSDFYAKKLGVAAEDVPGLFKRAADEGVIGELPMDPGRFAVKPNVNIRGGGDIAAGGGGMGIVPYVLPAAASRSLVGAGIGGAVGGVAGAIQDDEDRLGGATRGTLIGMGAGAAIANAGPVGQAGARAFAPAAHDLASAVGARFENTQADPEMWEAGIRAGWKGLQERGMVSTVKGPKDAWDAFWAQWRAQTVNTIKQLPQDALTERLTIEGIARDEFPGLTDQALRDTQGLLRREREAGIGPLDSNLPYFQKMRALGQDKLIADDAAVSDLLGTDFGGSLANDPNLKQFGPVGRGIAGALIGLGSAAKTVNPVAPAYGVGRGLAAPFVDDMIRFMNGVQHDKFRYLLGDLALDRDLPHLAEDYLSELARAGHDVRPLEGRRGLFSPSEVAAVAGAQAGKDWDGLVASLTTGQGDRIAFLGGDFRKGSETTVERGISKAAPFSRWGIRYAPVLAEIAARHPRAALFVTREMQRQQDEAKAQGKRGYQAGYTISDKTPLVGLAARVRNGGGEGTLTLDPLGAVMPYGDLLGGGDDLPEDATGYQKVVNAAGKVGFSPSPLVQSLAYVGGKDYRTPSSLSRTAGLEAGADAIPAAVRLALLKSGHGELYDLVPDMPQLPSGRNLLDAGRTLLEPVSGQKAVAATDPVMKRYAELVYTKTGKTLDDKSNQAYLLDVGLPDSNLWQLATVQARVSGAATNLTGMASPIQTIGQTKEAGAAQQATAGLPFTRAEIQAKLDGGQTALADAMQARNDRYTGQHPEANTYKVNDRGDVPYELLRQWEASMKDFRFVVGETAYQRILQQKKIELGLIKPQVKRAS